METGAEVTAINPDTYRRLGSPPLTKSTKVLYGPSRHVLPVQGHFSVFLRHGTRSTRQRVYVIDGLKRNLLGLPSMIDLQLVSRVDTTESEEHEITSLQRLRYHRGRIHHQTQGRSCPLLAVRTPECSNLQKA